MQTKKKTPVIFSIRADKEIVGDWKLYAQAAGLTLTRMTIEAMTEYMNAHPLTGYKQKMYEAMKGVKHMSVGEWIADEVGKAIYACEERHGRHFSEGDKIPYINELVEECADGWQGTEDPLADENEWWRDHTVEYIEEKAEEIVEHISSMYDEADPEED